MLNLIKIEFLKLKRKKLIWFMLLTALVMPFFTLLYFNYFGDKGVDYRYFFRWSALSFTDFIILPIILGVLSTMLMHEENQNGILNQLWIVPISKFSYLFSKFFVVLIYSIAFMMITFIASIMLSMLSGYVVFQWESVFYLLKKCLEVGLITPFAMIPILALASSQKGYIFPICTTLLYTFFSFFIMGINLYLHPISSASLILMRNNDIQGVALPPDANIPLAFICIGLWAVISIFLVNVSLKRRK